MIEWIVLTLLLCGLAGAEGTAGRVFCAALLAGYHVFVGYSVKDLRTWARRNGKDRR